MDSSENDMKIQIPQYKRKRKDSAVFYTGCRIFVCRIAVILSSGCSCHTSGNLQEANQQIMKYSDAVSSQRAELTKAQSQAQESGDTVEAASKQIEEEKKKSSSYEALIEAYSALQQQNTDEAA